MSVLSKMKLSTETKAATQDNSVQRRLRLIEALTEQGQIADALIKGEPCNIFYTVYENDEETGERKQVQKPKRLRQWFWHNIDSTWFIEVRYANKVLELGKNQKAIEVGAKDKLPKVINSLIDAARAGELDKQMEAAGQRKKKA